MVLLFISMSALLVFYFDESLQHVIVIITGGIAVGLMTLMLRAFIIPSNWLFKKRHGIEGALLLID